MKFRDLDGREHKKQKKSKPLFFKSKSKIQSNLKEILFSIYPTTPIIEEFSIPGEQLYIDFYIHQLGLAFEVHGAQHYKYIRHFHGNLDGYRRSKARDLRKREWCELNSITLVVIDGRKDFTEKDVRMSIVESLDAQE